MIIGIIPARYASTRVPGKPLVDLMGKTMIRRVYEQASQSKSLHKVVVATDDERIYTHVRSFGGDVVMTGAQHPSGTDRCLDALMQQEETYTHVINIQGDEPFIDPTQIDLLAETLLPATAELATLIIPVKDTGILFDHSKVKVVLNSSMEALYFSRQAIPWIKGVAPEDWHRQHAYFRHVGIYGYRTDILQQITRLPVSSLEQAESLEQLRWLENGFRIRCAVTNHDSFCIDNPEDVTLVLKQYGLG
jgi:3-deoxy-manno-octulosonate cytidylyltransferase (CMP-KDO synthetase)